MSSRSGSVLFPSIWVALCWIVPCRLASPILGFPGGSVVKNPPDNVGDTGLIPGPQRFPWKRKWQPTPVFLPGNFYGQRILVGYSPWGHRELDMT